MKIPIFRPRKGSDVVDVEEIDISGDYTDVLGVTDIQFPHCDALILHSPGTCEFCDQHPGWQKLRSAQGIAFSDMPETDRVQNNLVPCPSTFFRAAGVRDRWAGNVPSTTAGA